jgi:hypothetical protein
VRRRHGKEGHVRLAIDVEPELKDELIRVADARDTSVVYQVRLALWHWVMYDSPGARPDL